MNEVLEDVLESLNDAILKLERGSIDVSSVNTSIVSANDKLGLLYGDVSEADVKQLKDLLDKIKGLYHQHAIDDKYVMEVVEGVKHLI